MQQAKLYGIIGQPLGHSISPAVHNWAFAQRHYAGNFYAWPMHKEQLADFITSVRLLGIAGVCVTIPHKEHIMPLLDKVSERAQRIGAVNTLYWKDGLLCGENTDVDGFMLPLQQHTVAKRALILGAGGAARAVIMGLKELGVSDIVLTNHNEEKALQLAKEFQVQSLPWKDRMHDNASWIINTTPLGMRGKHEGISPFPAEAFGAPGLAYDIVYNPLETQFLHDAAKAGWQTQDGLDMFVGQACKQMLLWTNEATPFSETRNFIETKLSLT